MVSESSGGRRPGARREVQRALASRRSLRRAIRLSEILGPPKALQPLEAGLGQPLEGARESQAGPRHHRNGTAVGRGGAAARVTNVPLGVGDGRPALDSPHPPMAEPADGSRRLERPAPSIVESARRALGASASAIKRLVWQLKWGLW